jgi:ribosomal protein S18 acetylase RimI-like enzyme
MAADEIIRIRPYLPEDRGQVMALASRLTVGVAAWRDPGAVLTAVQGWVRDSVDAADQPGHVAFVAAGGDGVAGVITVKESSHFSGQADAYVSELIVRAGLERRGIASRLMDAAEAWAAEAGYAFLTLQTGAANETARAFYAAAGFREEEVQLTKAIGRSERPAPDERGA